MKIDFERAVELLKGNNNFLVLTHANPDGDTIGGGLALVYALRKAGKRARLINNDEIPQKYSYLFENMQEDDFCEEFIVSVDVAEKKLLGSELTEKYGDKVDLGIDHHSSSKLFAKETYTETDSASACEVVYLLIKAMGVEINKDIANCLFTGCSTDTGCFKYANVTARTHLIAAELISAGAENGKINAKMFDSKTKSSIMLEKMCLNRLKFFADGKVALITVTKEMFEETGAVKSDLDIIKPLTRQIEGVKIGVTIKYEGNAIGVSIRSNEDYDASEICKHFGGGGHIRAAGCEFREPIEEVEKKVISYILENVI